MGQVNSLNHTRWECKHHIVFMRIFRPKTAQGEHFSGFSGTTVQLPGMSVHLGPE